MAATAGDLDDDELHDDRDVGVEELDDDDLPDDDVAGEWLVGLRHAGLPLRHPVSPSAPSPAVQRLLGPAPVEVSAGVIDLVRSAVASSTADAYQADWRIFDAWTEVRGYGRATDATAVTVAEYVTHQVTAGLALSTIRRRLAAIRFVFERDGRASPTFHPLVLATLAGAARTIPTAQRQAAPLRLRDMRRLVWGLQVARPNHPATPRDQLLIGLGWAGALRASELVALDVADLEFVGDPERADGGLVVHVRRSTTDQHRAGDVVGVPYPSIESGCPVRLALRHCRKVRSGPLFRAIDRHGQAHQRLGAEAVTRILRPHIADLLRVDGLPVDERLYSAHSLRAGFVTEARAHDVPDARIARHTRHAHPGDRRTNTLDRYDRPTDLFERPALDPSWW